MEINKTLHLITAEYLTLKAFQEHTEQYFKIDHDLGNKTIINQPI